MATLLGDPLELVFGYRDSDIVTASDCDSQSAGTLTQGSNHEDGPEYLEWHDPDRHDNFEIYIEVPTSIKNTADITTQLDLDLNGILQATIDTSTMNTADRISGYCFLFEQWTTDSGEGDTGLGTSGSGTHTRRKIYPSADEDESIWAANGQVYQGNFRAFVDNYIGTANKQRTEQYFPHWNYEYTSESFNRYVYPVGTTEPDPWIAGTEEDPAGSYDDSALEPRQTFRLNLRDLNGWNGKFDPFSTYSGASNSKYFIGIHFTVDNTVGSATSDDFGFGVKTFDIKATQSPGPSVTPTLFLSDPDDIDLQNTLSFTDDLSTSVATRSETNSQTDQRRVNLFQSHIVTAGGGFSGTTQLQRRFSELYNWNTTELKQRYLRQGYTNSNYVADDPFNAQDRYDYQILLVSDQLGKLLPEFDFAEFHSATISAYTLTFEYRKTDVGSIEVGFNNQTTYSIDLTTTTPDPTWYSASIDQTDVSVSDMIRNYSGMLQAQIALDSSVFNQTTYIRNIKLSVTFTGTTDIRGNRLVAGTVTQSKHTGTPSDPGDYNIIDATGYSGSTGVTGFSPSKVISTLHMQNFYTPPSGSIYPNNSAMSFALNSGASDAEVQVITNTGTLDTVDVNQNDNARSFGSDVGGDAPTDSWQGESYYGIPDRQDLFPIIHTNVLSYLDEEVDLANTAIKYNQLPYFSEPDYEQITTDIQFLYRMPLLAEATLDASFTTDFKGGIRIDGSAQLDASFTETLTNNLIGSITPAVLQRVQFGFFPDPATIDPNTGKIHARLHDDVRDINGNPIAPGARSLRRDPALPTLDTAFTQASTANPLRISTANLQSSWSVELEPSATGIIIDNAETESFAFEITATGQVTKVPNRFRELLLPAQTRTYAVTGENRDYAVNTESRSYKVQQEQRQRTVATETRILKQKGYNT